MSGFPTSPSNGQQVTLNGVTYIYNSTKTAWLRNATTGANLTANSMTVAGNVSAAYFVGNGAFLTGIISGGGGNYSNTEVASYLTTHGGNISGTITTVSQPNITAVGTLGSLSVTGNVTAGGFSGPHYGSGAGLTSIPNSALTNSSLTINGTSASLGGTATITANAATLTGAELNSTVIASSLTSVGNLTALNSSGNISTTGYFIGNGAFLTGIVGAGSSTYSNTNVASYLTTYTGALGNLTSGITSAGTIQSTGIIYANANITSSTTSTGALVVTGGVGVSGSLRASAVYTNNYYYANGAAFTGNGVGGSGAYTVSNTAPVSPSVRDLWYEPDSDVLFMRINDGNADAWVDIFSQSLNTSSNLSVAGNGVVNGSVTINSSNFATAIVNGGLTGTGNIGSASTTFNYGYFNNLSVTANVTAAGFSGTHYGSGAGLTAIPNSALTNSSVTVNGTAISLGASGTVTANAATLTGTSLNSTVVASSLTSVGNLTALTVTGAATTGSLTVGNITINTTANTIATSTGTLVLDPNPTGSGGLVVIQGNLQVTGTTTTIDSTTLTVADLNITLANGAATAAAANGAGLTVAGANATLTYQSTADQWAFNKPVAVTGATAIVNAGTNGTGNIGASDQTFDTIFAKATTAQYADLAECYLADAAYAPGTVLEFGGEFEVTVAQDETQRIAGVVSTNPAYIMNHGLTGENVVQVALMGRVPVRVRGIVHKGDFMVSGGSGYARPTAYPKFGTVIGKALEDFNGVEGVIEVVVGRL
jgi:hypothetical protein